MRRTTRTKTKKRRRKKRTGSKAAFLLLVAVIAAWLPLSAKQNGKLESYAVVAGTVFQESGFALPRAEVALRPVSGDSGTSAHKKMKELQAVSDRRGEFAFRVPASPGRYTILVRAKGYAGQEKAVAVTSSERVDVTFQLQRESK